jgi:hypothetical protein
MGYEHGRRPRRRWRHACIACVTVGLIAVPIAAADTNPQPVDHTRNALGAPAPVNGAVLGSASSTQSGTPICSTTPSTALNVNTDCEENGPHNETSIAVDPTNPRHMIGGVNDYQLSANSGGHVAESILSRAHVTFDGGQTWTEYPLNSNSSYQATGDPSVAFDATGHANYATLGFRFVSKANSTTADVLVSNSGDGGKSWKLVRVAAGSGNGTSVGDFLDKEYIAAWGHGNAIVTYGDFRQAQKGAVTSAQIYASVTHDYGATWSTPQLISGSLNQSFGSDPVVAADGRIFVSFLNTDDLSTGRDTYKVSEVDPTTGALKAGPFSVGLVYEGNTDSPFALGRETYQNSAFRSWAYGNIAADPTNPAHLAVVFSDWRDGPRPAQSDPYKAQTNGDVIVSQSYDRGRTWSAPTPIALTGEQWMPWSSYDASGRLLIGTFDRSADPANLMYNYSLATETAPGATSFTSRPISTAMSDPTKGDRWFAVTLNPAFPRATAFQQHRPDSGHGERCRLLDRHAPAELLGRHLRPRRGRLLRPRGGHAVAVR